MRMEAAERGAIGKGKGDGGVEEEAGLGRGDWGAGMEWEVVGGREGGSLGGGGFFQTSGGGGRGREFGGGVLPASRWRLLRPGQGLLVALGPDEMPCLSRSTTTPSRMPRWCRCPP